MNKFPDENFLLQTSTSRQLYHDFAEGMPIIDYHCHLPPDQIANDINFKTISQAWLYGDHYKWRAMRANGVDESYITGTQSDRDKFSMWAETVPYTLRNPLYQWTHLELQRYFDVQELLNKDTAGAIYNHCNELLQTPGFTVRNILRRMNVKFICTTDDPADSLEHHSRLIKDGFEIRVFPAFRPDKAMNVDDIESFNKYTERLEQVSNISVDSYSSFLEALKIRHDYFASMGCTVSDHGLEHLYADDYKESEVKKIFSKIKKGKEISKGDRNKFRSAMLHVFAIWDWEKGWVQQYHLGALRNNNTRMLKELGADTGWDSIGDFGQGRSLAAFLDKLDRNNQLTKTIIYNLNPADNEMMAAMTGNFNDGSVAGKIQYGAAWWFLDQKEGIVKQINALSNMGLLSRFIGMLTDSRSFLSYPRHEYFRRILCNLFGKEIENGDLPHDIEWTGKIIRDICFHNAKGYFNWEDPQNQL